LPKDDGIALTIRSRIPADRAQVGEFLDVYRRWTASSSGKPAQSRGGRNLATGFGGAARTRYLRHWHHWIIGSRGWMRRAV